MKSTIFILLMIFAATPALSEVPNLGKGESAAPHSSSAVLATIEGDLAQNIYDFLTLRERPVGGGDTTQEFLKYGTNLACVKSANGHFRCSFLVKPDETTEGFY